MARHKKRLPLRNSKGRFVKRKKGRGGKRKRKRDKTIPTKIVLKEPRARKRRQRNLAGRYVSKDIAWRLFMHIPVGLAIVALGLVNPFLGAGLLIIFLAYEIAQDWRKRDCGYKDIAGCAWGLGIGGLALGVIIFLNLFPASMQRFPLF